MKNEMNTNPFRDPLRALKAMVVADTELIRASDPLLGAALNVTPLTADFGPLGKPGTATRDNKGRGLAYRAARKIYRALKDIKGFQPILERVRAEIRRY
jgi:hypothetical protein